MSYLVIRAYFLQRLIADLTTLLHTELDLSIFNAEDIL